MDDLLRVVIATKNKAMSCFDYQIQEQKFSTKSLFIMKMFKSIHFLFALLAVSLLSMGCEETATTNVSDGMGQLTVTMTDAPFPIDLIAEASVTINKIEIRGDTTLTTNDSTEAEAGFTVISEEEQSFNLLELQNGVKASLADIEIEAGSYDLIRLYVSDASILLKDSTSYDLKVPSGSQSGIKVFIEPDLIIEDGTANEVLLDFDVSKSFIAKGNMNTPAGIKGFNFKPTLRAVQAEASGSIAGMVTDTADVALANVQVEVWQDTVITTAFTDSTGAYAVIGLDEDMYDLRATKAGYDSVTVSGVNVDAGSEATADFVLTPAAADTSGN